MNNDLISREALIKWIDDSVSQYGHTYSTDMLNMWGLFKDYLINNAPTVNILNYGGRVVPDTLHGWRYEERPQGEWIKKVDDAGFVSYICSECGAEIEVEDPKDDKFCFNCGAKMQKGGAE